MATSNVTLLVTSAIFAFALPTSAACNAFAGKWMWFVGGEVAASAGGTFVQQSGNSGTWTCIDAARGIVRMKWRTGFVNTMVISSDGRSLSSADPTQAFVKATRVAQSPGTQPTASPAREGAPPASPSSTNPPSLPPTGQPPVQPTASISTAMATQAETAFTRGRNLAASGKCREAIPFFDQAVRANPRHARAYSDRGRCKAAQGQLGLALEDLNQAVLAEPHQMGPYYNRAGLRADSGDGMGALADLDRSIRLNPMNAAPRAARAALFELMGRPQEARLEAETAYKQVDTFKSAKRTLVDQIMLTWRAKKVRSAGITPAAGANPIEAASRAVAAGQDRAALALLDTALLQSRDNTPMLAFRGRLHRELGQATQAVEDLTLALQRASNPHLYVERGLAYRQLCRFRDEIADYTQAIRLDPRFIKAYIERAYSTMYYDKRLDAIPDLTRVIEIDPNHWLAYNYRGQLNRYWFHLREAIADFRKSISINPNFAHSQCNLGFALREGRVMDESNRWLERCYALDPSEREVARKEFSKIIAKEEQGARDHAAHMEWLRTRPRGGDTKMLCEGDGGYWMVEKQASAGGFCMN